MVTIERIALDSGTALGAARFFPSNEAFVQLSHNLPKCDLKYREMNSETPSSVIVSHSKLNINLDCDNMISRRQN
jgi:hypothetical protein